VQTITAFSIVKNETANLEACVESLRGCVDRVAIFDTGSTDGTCELLARLAKRADLPPLSWDRLPFEGFGPTYQLALERVETPWALKIDADEQISPQLAERLRALRASGDLAKHDAYYIRRRNRVFGHPMRQSNLANERLLRLFRTVCGSISPTPIHEGIVLVPGARVGEIDAPLWHDSMRSWRAYLAKVDHYTTLDAARGVRPPSVLHLVCGPPTAFVLDFIGRGGIRDGWPGFVWALTKAWSIGLRDWKLLRRR
jgi:glycosyltransferase involved in cell wall biosynthesis